jgi:predicted dehydrogenase
MATKKVRYGIVGLGHIAQVAVLPAFANASKNSELAALVSDEPKKLEELGRRYGINRLYSYDQFDECLKWVDAVYITLPNHLHREYTLRAAKAGVHVLCEKPMAVTVKDCEAMMRAAKKNDIRLMIAYRLHFERTNLEAVKIATSGRLGAVRIFESCFTMDVRAGDIRLKKDYGGGPLYDIGVYCINAARYLFQAEPVEAFAMAVSSGDPRFREVDEIVSATLRFPGDRLASFTVSFGQNDVASYRIVGSKGDLRVEPAYEYAMPLEHHLTIGERKSRKEFAKRDQFAPELIHFSDSILGKREPEPSGLEGAIDVAIVEALNRSIRTGRPVKLKLPEKKQRPTMKQEIRRPAVNKPKTVEVKAPSR